MRTSLTITFGLFTLALGYFLGVSTAFSPMPVWAQAEAAPASISDETRGKIKAASDAMNAAAEALKMEMQYNPATKGLNTFAILSGSCNSLKDLESGRGVDPETFAALYSDLAVDEVAEKLSRNPEGKLTYNGKLVQMYSVSRLKSIYAARSAITGEELLPAVEDPTKKPATKKPAEKTE